MASTGLRGFEARIGKLESSGVRTDTCVSITERRISPSGEVVTYRVGTDELYTEGAPPKDRPEHKCGERCIVIGINRLGPDPQDPGFKDAVLRGLEVDVAHAPVGRHLAPWERKGLEDERRLCLFYGIPFPPQAQALLDRPETTPLTRRLTEAPRSDLPERGQDEPAEAFPPMIQGRARDRVVTLVKTTRPRRLEDTPVADQPPCATCGHPSRLHSEQSEWRPCRVMCVLGPDDRGNGPCSCAEYKPGEFPPVSIDAVPTERTEEACQ